MPFYELKCLYSKAFEQQTPQERGICTLFGGVRYKVLNIFNDMDVRIEK